MFDTEIFINEVSVRPPLWDNSLKDYSNRDVKGKLWIEVAKVVHENWEQLSTECKNKEVKELQKKWKSLRDAFTRELRNQKQPSGSAQKKRKKYCYFDQLLFLVGTTEDGGSTTNLVQSPTDQSTIEENGETEESTVGLPPIALTATQTPPPIALTATKTPAARSKKTQQSLFETAVINHLKQISQVDEAEVADKNFLLSFLPMMKKLPVNTKLWARMRITEVMQQAVSGNTFNSLPHYQPPQPSQSQPQCYYQNFSPRPQYHTQPQQQSYSKTVYNSVQQQLPHVPNSTNQKHFYVPYINNPPASDSDDHSSINHNSPVSPSPSDSVSNSDIFSVISVALEEIPEYADRTEIVEIPK